MPELHELSVVEAAAQIREGTLSPVALAEALLTRIAALNGDLQAWVTIDRDAVLSAAREREAEVQRGDPLGLIHGVPVGLKDIFYTEGMLTACGSKVYADFVPEFDATSVANIKAAGGIIMGKAVTTEFASSDPSPTRNPWNLEHTPGGSSSGSSAAVAARMVPAALGSQTGGSTCRPAAYNGIVGVKPTYGRISRYGVAPLSWSLDHVGILTRTVADAALMLTVLSGADDNDPGSLREPVPDFSAQMAEHDRPPRIGLVRQYYRDYATPEMWAHTEASGQSTGGGRGGGRGDTAARQLRRGAPVPAHRVERRVRGNPRGQSPRARRRLRPAHPRRHGDGHDHADVGVPESPAAAAAVPRRLQRDGGEGRRRDDTGDAGAGSPGPEHHRRRGVPGAVVGLRVAHGGGLDGPERAGDAHGGAVRRTVGAGGPGPGRGAVVRADRRVEPGAANRLTSSISEPAGRTIWRMPVYNRRNPGTS